MDVPNGLHKHRLTPEADCPREVALAEAWRASHQYSDMLAQLFQVPCDSGDDGAHRDFMLGGYRNMPLGEPTERDRIVAATVFQWVGSNIGLGTVIDALAKCGYAIQWKQTP